MTAVGELTLRRYRAGELEAHERAAIERALAANAELRAKLASLDNEQLAFERDVPFARFEAGVTRARRRPSRRGSLMVAVGGFVAAAAGIALFARPAPTNRLKGGDDAVLVRVAGGDGQRDAVPGTVTALGAGDRVRIGYRVSAPRHLVILALDDARSVTPLYPTAGAAIPVAPTTEPVYLPNSVEFTGRGRERLAVLVSERSFLVDEAIEAARRAYDRAHGDVAAASIAAEAWTEIAFVFAKP